MIDEEWTLKRIWREFVMFSILGLVGWAALQLTETKVLLAESAIKIEQCFSSIEAYVERLDDHEKRIHDLEIDVNSVKVRLE